MKGYLLIVVIPFCTAACSHQGKTQEQRVNYDSLREPLIRANKIYVKKESDEIDQYAKFRGWNMTTTGTGLRYMIYARGNGELAKTGQRARINYKASLLDGTLCYSSDKTGPRKFVIGQDHIESGIHEAVTYLHVGDKAIVILPSHLAFGFVGDDKKIPPRSSIVYEIELLSLD